MTKAEVRSLFPALLRTWRELPEVRDIPEQDLAFGRFWNWLRECHPDTTRFRSRMGAETDMEQWFDFATHQSWRN